MSSGRGRGNRNGGRRVQGQSDTNRPSNYGGLVKTVCDATSWPKEDVEKALAENDWNPDSTVDAILAGVHGMPTQEWHQVGKPKKKPTQPSGSQSEGYKGSRRAAPTITQSEGGNGGKGAPNEKRGKTPRAGFSKKPPTATPPAAAPVKVQAAPDAAAESHPQPASAPAPSVNKWASGAPSFQPKKPEPAPPAPVEHVQPKPKAEPPQPEPVPEPKVVESAPVSPEPAPVPVPVHVERPSPVAAPVVEQKQPEAAGAEVDPKLQFSRAKPAGDSRLGSKIELSELMSGSQEYPPEMQHMILPPGGPDMPPYMFYNPGFPPHAFDPQAHAEGDKSKELQGEAGNHGPPAPYMPYPFYPPYYPPYGMGQFGGQPQYFPPSMYKQAFPFPQGFSEDGQAPPMQFYGFPMYAPPPHAGQSEGQFDGQSHGDWGQQHPAIPPMMMAPRFPGGFHQGPGQGQPGQQGQRGNRQ